MLIQKAFKYELIPEAAMRRAFSRFAGAKRFVWNKALDVQQKRYAAGEKHLRYFDLNNLLPAWKRENPWMREAHSQVLQQSLKDLDRAFKNFFEKRAERPTFKKKFKSGDSFRFPQGFRLEEANSRVYLPKIGWVRYRNSRPVAGTAKNITISRKADKWFMSIQTECEAAEPLHPSTSIVGIDLGVSRFATLSDGSSHIDPLNAFKKHETRLRRYQRMMSRKQKFSKNWKKAKALVQKQYRKIGDSRRDFLQKSSTEISKNHAIVVLEDLKVKNMSASASGTLAQPGTKVKQKSGLNRSILDQGWGDFRRMLEYKQVWRGGHVIAVSAMYTSQTCPSCLHVSKNNRKTQADFACVKCGYASNADFVGAVNILRAGHARLACEVNPDVKDQQQEPTKIAA
jgi:putative transposase